MCNIRKHTQVNNKPNTELRMGKLGRIEEFRRNLKKSINRVAMVGKTGVAGVMAEKLLSITAAAAGLPGPVSITRNTLHLHLHEELLQSAGG